MWATSQPEFPSDNRLDAEFASDNPVTALAARVIGQQTPLMPGDYRDKIFRKPWAELCLAYCRGFSRKQARSFAWLALDWEDGQPSKALPSSHTRPWTLEYAVPKTLSTSAMRAD